MRIATRRVTAAVVSWLAASAALAAADGPRSVTVPFDLDHNRMIVAVGFVRPDGSVREARAWVDTGNDGLLLAEPLARELGFDVPAFEGGAQRGVAVDSAPPVRIGGLTLDVRGIRTVVQPWASVRPGVPAEAQLPASALRSLHVVFDYPARRLTVAGPGVLRPRGAPVPCRVHPGTGLPMVTAIADGDTVALGIDNGSAGTWVSDTLTRRWLARHPRLPRATGAAGSANFFGFPFESTGVLMRLPELRIGPVRARSVALLGLDQGLFDWYSKKSAGPVLGFIGANVLRGYRVEIDFPGRMTWWEAGPPTGPVDLDLVGLAVRAESDGGYTVAGVVAKDGRPVVDGVHAGDRLVRVDGMDTAGRTIGEVVDALRGAPGETRTLVLERDGTRLTVAATVTRLP